MIKVIGKTFDGKLVLSGLFWLYATHGIPLEVSITKGNEHGVVFSLHSFLIDAMLDGWEYRKAIALIKEATEDSK